MKTFLILLVTLLSLPIFSQVKSEYERIYENDTCKQSYLYSKSKMYIADVFRSANNVIQNDDPSFGSLICKGTIEVSLGYYFDFTLKIRVKDGASKITVTDISNTFAPYKYATLEINNFRGIWKDNLTEKQYNGIMEQVNKEMESIVSSYYRHMDSEDDGF
jgi:hypothetical protein